MKTIVKIQTLDGVLHDNTKDAIRHLNKLEANLLTTITCKIAERFKIAYDNKDGDIGLMGELTKARLDAGSYILENMDLFAQLQKISEDKTLPIDDDDE